MLLQERAKKFWGTKGPYVEKRTLLAFVEQLGHDHGALMENTRVESEGDDIPETVRPLRSAIGQRRDSSKPIGSTRMTGMKRARRAVTIEFG